MEKEFVPYTESLELKQLGFDEPCFGCYDEKRVFGLTVMSIKQYYTNSKEDTWNCSAPTYSQAFRWFREKHNMNHSIILHETTFSNDYQYLVLSNDNEFVEVGYITYEEAELECLKKLIEIVKTK